MNTDTKKETAVDNLVAVKKEIKNFLVAREKKLWDLVMEENLTFFYDQNFEAFLGWRNMYDKADPLVKYAWHKVYGMDGRVLDSALMDDLCWYCGKLYNKLYEKRKEWAEKRKEEWKRHPHPSSKIEIDYKNV